MQNLYYKTWLCIVRLLLRNWQKFGNWTRIVTRQGPLTHGVWSLVVGLSGRDHSVPGEWKHGQRHAIFLQKCAHFGGRKGTLASHGGPKFEIFNLTPTFRFQNGLFKAHKHFAALKALLNGLRQIIVHRQVRVKLAIKSYKFHLQELFSSTDDDDPPASCPSSSHLPIIFICTLIALCLAIVVPPTFSLAINRFMAKRRRSAQQHIVDGPLVTAAGLNLISNVDWTTEGSKIVLKSSFRCFVFNTLFWISITIKNYVSLLKKMKIYKFDDWKWMFLSII